MFFTCRWIKQFAWEMGQENELPRREGRPCQRAAGRAGLGWAVSSRKQGEAARSRKAQRVIQVKVLRCMSKAKGHTQGPEPETQPTCRASGQDWVRMELGTNLEAPGHCQE